MRLIACSKCFFLLLLLLWMRLHLFRLLLRVPVLLLGVSVLYIIERNGTGLTDDGVRVFQQHFDDALVVDHFSDGDQRFVLHNRRFIFFLAHRQEEGPRYFVNIIHLGENKCDFVLEEGTASVEIL